MCDHGRCQEVCGGTTSGEDDPHCYWGWCSYNEEEITQFWGSAEQLTSNRTTGNELFVIIGEAPAHAIAAHAQQADGGHMLYCTHRPLHRFNGQDIRASVL